MMKIFLDVDGVIINGLHSRPELTVRWDKELKEDLGVDPEQLRKHFFYAIFNDVIIGQKDLFLALEDVLPKLEYKGAAVDIVDYWFEKDTDLNHELLKAVRLLSQRDDVLLYLATNQEKYRADYLWNKLRFKDIFTDIYFSGELGVVKEDPDFFKKINEDLLIEKDEKVFFFDDCVANVESAKSEGWEAFTFDCVEDFTRNPSISPLLV